MHYFQSIIVLIFMDWEYKSIITGPKCLRIWFLIWKVCLS